MNMKMNGKGEVFLFGRHDEFATIKVKDIVNKNNCVILKTIISNDEVSLIQIIR